MRPGALSSAGFLGPDERLADVLEKDAQALAALKVTARQVADALAAVLEPIAAGKQTSGQTGHFRIWLKRYKGSPRCPFLDDPKTLRCLAAGGQRLASMDWRIRNLRTGVEEKGPGLLVHLIAGHGFFEGFRSSYRVAPVALARLLEIGPFRHAPPVG